MNKVEDQDKSDDISVLKDIPTVGELKSRALIEAGYSSIEDIEEASVEKLSEVEGIGRVNAERIKDGLDGSKEDFDDHSEVVCPGCGSFINISEEKCPECEREISFSGKVYLPEEEIEDPILALADFEKRIKDGEENAEVWYGKAAILEKLGAQEEALEAYDRVIELDPVYDQIWTAKANISLQLGKLQDAAKAYKVAVNKHQINIPEMPVEEETEVVEEHDISVEKVESKVSKARSKISDLRGKEIPLDHLEDKLSEVREARNEDEREKAIERAEDLIGTIQEAEEVIDSLKEVREELEELEDFGGKTDEIEEKEEEILAKLKEGGFEEAEQKLEDILEDIERFKKEVEKREQIKEEVSKEEGEAEEVEVEEKEEGAEEEEEMPEEVAEAGKEMRKEKFEEVFEEAKEKLAKARKSKIDIDDVKDSISDAVDANKAEDYESGIERAKEAKKRAERILDIFEMVDEGKEIIKELRRENADIGPLLKEMREGKSLADKGNYDRSEEKLDEVIDKLEETLKLVREGEEVELDEEKISLEQEVENLISAARTFDIELGDAEGLKEDLKGALEEEDRERAEELAKEAKDEVLDGVPDILDSKIKNSKEELKEAKLSGKDIDVPKCIHHLKQARKSEEKGELEKSLLELQKYQEELDKE